MYSTYPKFSLPKFDRHISAFIDTFEIDTDACPRLDKEFVVGIQCRGFIYRHIHCQNIAELDTLANYLDYCGDSRQALPPKGVDRLWVLLDER